MAKNVLGWLPGMTGLLKILANSVEAPEARQALNLVGATAEDDPVNEQTTVYVDRSLHGKTVAAAAPDDGQCLVYNAANDQWESTLITASTTVTLGENAAAGKVMVSANAADPNAALIATPTAIANAGGLVLGVLKTSGLLGESKEVAGPGSVVDPAITGLTATGSTSIAIVSATGAVVRAAYPLPTDTIVGTVDKQGNLTVGPPAPSVNLNLATTLNVRAFGATGDGTTDDSAAFAAAIAAKEVLVALGFVVTIYVPAGQYKLLTALDLGTRSFTLEGDATHYFHQNAFGDAAWTLTFDVTNGVVGSVLRWTGATDGLVISTYPAGGMRFRDLALIGPGSGTTTGFNEAAAGGVVDLELERILIGNWGRGLNLGGAEETRCWGVQIRGCTYGVVIAGTPQITGGATNSQYRDLMVQSCTIGMIVRTCTSVHLDGGSTLFQANGKSLTALGATNASPIVVQVSSTKGLETGMRYDSSGFVGNTAANVTDGTLTVVDATHISLDGTTGNGVWTSGGTIKVGGGVLVQPNIYVTALAGFGTSPPAVTLTGTPIVYPCAIEIDITTPGVRGVALFTWKLNGVTQQTGQTTAATFALGATGLTANFPVGTYSNTNVYTCSSFGHVIGFSIEGAWFEANKRFGVFFDMKAPNASCTLVKFDKCRFSDTSNNIDFTPGAFGAGAAVNRLAVHDCYGGGDLVIPAAGVYGYDIGCGWSTYSNGYPAGWAHFDPSGTIEVPLLKSNAQVTGSHFGYGTGNIAGTGVVRVPNNSTALAARNAANTADLVCVSTDNANDIIFGERTNGTDTYLYAKNRAFIGVSATNFAVCISTSGYEKHAYPILGGDGTDSVPNSPHALSGTVSSSLGDSDQPVANTQYSRRRCEFTDTLTANRKRTFPTPASANEYYEKTIVNSTTGGFGIVVSCGAGATVTVAAGKTAILGFKSTNGGDVVRITADT